MSIEEKDAAISISVVAGDSANMSATTAAASPPAPPPTIVLVGSTNPVKVNSTRAAFAAAFPSRAFEVVGVAGVQSGVPDQPMGDAQTREGALNRARACAARAHEFERQAGGTVGFCVGLEGGLCEAPYDTGGGAGGTTLECFAWLAVLKVNGGAKAANADADGDGDNAAADGTAGARAERWGIARTASFPLPPALASLVRGGMELGDADDAVFGRSNSKQEDGTVGILSHGAVDRTEYYRHALVLALVPLTNEALYYGGGDGGGDDGGGAGGGGGGGGGGES